MDNLLALIRMAILLSLFFVWGKIALFVSEGGLLDLEALIVSGFLMFIAFMVLAWNRHRFRFIQSVVIIAAAILAIGGAFVLAVSSI